MGFFFRNRLVLIIVLPILLMLIGTTGFHYLEDISWFDSLYVTVISLTTIGYGDIAPKTFEGRLFTMALVLTGVFTLFYVGGAVVGAIVSGELAFYLGKQQMERTLATLHDHLIVCGFGRMGRLVCREFSQNKLPFVIIDQDSKMLGDFQISHGIPLVGDATSDEVLKHAGIERARALVTVMASDAENLYTTMSARLLNSRLFIVARVEEAQSEQKLLRAGANRVVSPYVIGGNRVAQAVLRPTVMDFIELATSTEHLELQLEETRITAFSPLVGADLRSPLLKSDMKIMIVAIKKGDGKMHFNPTPETPIQVGDILVAIGRRDHLEKLDALAKPRE